MQDSKRDTDIKNRLLDSVGEGEGGMIWENGIETCIIPYKKWKKKKKIEGQKKSSCMKQKWRRR